VHAAGLPADDLAADFLLLESSEHPELAEDSAESLSSLLATLAQHFELVVVNTGAFWNGTHAVLAKACDRLILLMDQRATSVQGCKRAMELCERLEVPSTRLIFALNRCGRNSALSASDVALALGNQDVVAISDGGQLVDELLALGCPCELADSNNPFVSSLADLLDSLTPVAQSRPVSDAELAQSQLVGKLLSLPIITDFFRGLRNVAS